jgi:5-methylcytosine-specific restriction endonuclease McrA
VEFRKKSRNPDGLDRWCKECSKEQDKKLYESNLLKNREKNYKNKKKSRLRNYIFMIDYLSDKSCLDCGEPDPIVLEFDHQFDKKMNISELIKDSSIGRLETELNKCEIRCANCHRRKTAKDFKFYKNKLLGGETL